MPAPRRPRSAWLLVGSTPSVWVKVDSAGQRLSRFLANWRWYFVRGLLRAACSSSLRSFGLSRRGARLQPGAVGVGLVVVSGGEEVASDLEAVVAEPFLLGHAFAVDSEVAEQV
jgi:hypothetical protein